MSKINGGVLLLILVALAACQTAQQPAQQQAQASVAPSGQPPVVQSSGGLCDNPYIPVVEGATWTSNLHTDQGDMTQYDTITDLGSDAFLVETTQGSIQYVITWTCTAEGLLWLQTDGGMFSAVFPDMQWATNSYSGISIPKVMQPGDTWASSESLTATSGTGSQTVDLNLAFQAIGMESVSVPAGTFNAMHIDVVMEWVLGENTSTSTISDWFAEGVGLVKSVAQTGGTGGYSLELVSYSIP